ncbi:hypothetical protein EYF80_033522 [Liparis tanakae]|uniref:Uncharacterized protein n=1 Tax=Liparis tanakae TaxID=230148 RepID=A0A4Z2GS70_9TELE|nr:hypothetical protein EYF80_033522 [Liparis tanakae]
MPRLNEARCGCRDALPASRIDQLCAHKPEEPYMAREPGVHDTEVNVKYLKGALQGKSYIVSL